MGSKSGKWVRMPIRKNIRSPFALNTSLTCRAAFSDGVDWSAILIDLWEAPGWLMSELGRYLHNGGHQTFRLPVAVGPCSWRLPLTRTLRCA